MKTVKTLLFVSALFMLTAESCAQKKVVEGVSPGQLDSVSYAMGMNLGQNFKQSGLDVIDTKVFMQGMHDVFSGKDSLRFSEEQAQGIIRSFVMERHQALLAKNMEEGKKFLEGNKTKEGVVELPSGVQYKILAEGKGNKPTAEDTVLVKYRGTTIDGKEFDAWDDHGDEPAEFPVSQVIPGWSEGIQQLNEGTKAMLYIPSNLAYGERGNSAVAPNATLIFEVELVQVKKAQPKPETAETLKPGAAPKPVAVSKKK